MKNDERDATELAKRLSRGDLPEAWIAPPELRELRELVRYRGQAHRPAHLGQGPGPRRHGQTRRAAQPMGACSGPAGQRLLDEMPVEGVYRDRVESLRHLLEIYDRELCLCSPTSRAD